MVAIKCCVGSEQKNNPLLATDDTARGFLYDEGIPCFVFCFPIPYIIVSLRTIAYCTNLSEPIGATSRYRYAIPQPIER